MKITKKQLRNIIKEEIRRVLHVNESGSYYSKDKPYFPWDEFANSITVAEFYFTGQGWSERDISDIHPDGHEHVHNFMKRYGGVVLGIIKNKDINLLDKTLAATNRVVTRKHLQGSKPNDRQHLIDILLHIIKYSRDQQNENHQVTT